MIDLSHPSKASTLQVLVRSSGLAHAMLYVRRERAGFMGCDLVYVEYAHPTDGSIHELPFGTVNLEPGGYERLIELANRHEARAAAPRRMAEETPRR
jgi:hypothetical protein